MECPPLDNILLISINIHDAITDISTLARLYKKPAQNSSSLYKFFCDITLSIFLLFYIQTHLQNVYHQFPCNSFF